MFGIFSTIGLIIGCGAIASFLYMFVKNQGRKEERQKQIEESVKEALDVKKDIADHSYDDIELVNERLRKNARD